MEETTINKIKYKLNPDQQITTNTELEKIMNPIPLELKESIETSYIKRMFMSSWAREVVAEMKRKRKQQEEDLKILTRKNFATKNKSNTKIEE